MNSQLTPEQRKKLIADMEKKGDLDPECRGCREFYAAANPLDVFYPRHKARSWCESGKKPHCTCDTCF